MDYWQQQTTKEPLFKDLIWSRPEQKSKAGKLLIIGGNLHGISAPGEAYEIAQKQGVGECKVVIPDATRRLLGPKPPPAIELAASTPSGSFSSQAYDDLKSYIAWGNATLFAGDFGHNSETAILLEKLLGLPGLQVYTNDSLDYFTESPLSLLQRANSLLVVSLPQLQKIAKNADFSKAIILDIQLMQIIEALHEFTLEYPCHIITSHQGQVITASAGQVISTKLPDSGGWEVKIATTAAVWWLQNPQKPLQAMATAITQINL